MEGGPPEEAGQGAHSEGRLCLRPAGLVPDRGSLDGEPHIESDAHSEKAGVTNTQDGCM